MNKLTAAIIRHFQALRSYLCGGFWDVDPVHCGLVRRLTTRGLRTVAIAARGFSEDRCTLQASALTYITLVTIVPVLAVMLAFCKGIGVQERLMGAMGIVREEAVPAGDSAPRYHYRVVQEVKRELPAGTPGAESTAPAGERLRTVAARFSSLIKGEDGSAVVSAWAASLPPPMQEALISLFTYVDRTNFAALGMAGLVTMLVTVVMSISKLEKNFNSIWCIRRGRSLGRQVSEYLIVLLLAPIALLVVLTLAAFVNNGGFSELFPAASASAHFWNRVAGTGLLAAFAVAGFVFLYIFMPNTEVRFGAACIGGVCAAVMWGIVLWAYIRWQIGLANFNKIYGSFAALPFFLAWLYANWMVVLLGAEICYAVQNELILRKGKHIRQMAPGACHLLGLVIMNEVCRSFEEGRGRWNAATFAASHNVSIKEIEAAVLPLLERGFVLAGEEGDGGAQSYEFLLGRPPEQITLAEVSEAYLGMTAGDAARIALCLPPALAAELKRRRQQTLAELGGMDFAHILKHAEKITGGTVCAR